MVYAGTTATWFMCALSGTISTPGGGGDLEIPNVNIVSGQTYVINPMQYRLPLAYTY